VIDRTGTNDDRFGYYLDGEMNWASYDSTALKDSTYSLDPAGNRMQVYDGSVWKNYAPNALNQYTQAEDLTVTNNAEHQITDFDGLTFTYTNDGRLASVYSPSADTWIDFSYDALGRCVKRLKDGWDAKYSYYDGERELLECGVAGGAAFKNLYGKGIDEILRRIDTTKNWTYYYQQDQLGNVKELTWGDGTIVETFQYDAFGLLNKTASAWGNPFLFNGRRYQSTFGVYEYRARAYHPRLGRFTGEDPKLFDAGDYNLFRYCHNDPVDLTDPMGLSPFEPSGPERHVVTGSHIPASDKNLLSSRELAGVSTTGARAALSAAEGLHMALSSRNAVLRDKDGNPSSGERFDSQAKASSTLIDRSFSAQELSGDDPKKRYEYGGYGSQNKNDSNDYIIFGPYRGGRERGPYENTSRFRQDDPSPDGYRRAFVVYTHPFYRNDVDPRDRPIFAAMEGKPRVYLATPQLRGSRLPDPHVIDWPNP
jgi:RHS repeat-associated protein